jgi:mannose-1-phosphate guanylyltransferase
MHALVLAAGVGAGSGLTQTTCPKPMLDVGGEPILGYNFAMLARSAFRDVVVNLHYLPAIVRDYGGDGSRWGLTLTYSQEDQLLGTGGALAPFRDRFARGTFAVVYGDNVNDLDLKEMLRFHEWRTAAVTIAVTERDEVSHSGVCELAPDDRVIGFTEKPTPGTARSHWVNAGVLIAQPSLLDAIGVEVPADIGRNVLPAMLERGAPIYAYRMRGRHWWFDRASDYERAQHDVDLEKLARRLLRASADESGGHNS